MFTESWLNSKNFNWNKKNGLQLFVKSVWTSTEPLLKNDEQRKVQVKGVRHNSLQTTDVKIVWKVRI